MRRVAEPPPAYSISACRNIMRELACTLATLIDSTVDLEICMSAMHESSIAMPSSVLQGYMKQCSMRRVAEPPQAYSASVCRIDTRELGCALVTLVDSAADLEMRMSTMHKTNLAKHSSIAAAVAMVMAMVMALVVVMVVAMVVAMAMAMEIEMAATMAAAMVMEMTTAARGANGAARRAAAQHAEAAQLAQHAGTRMSLSATAHSAAASASVATGAVCIA